MKTNQFDPENEIENETPLGELIDGGSDLDLGDEEETEDCPDEMDDSMDGDHESALASVYGDNSGDFEDTADSFGGNEMTCLGDEE